MFKSKTVFLRLKTFFLFITAFLVLSSTISAQYRDHLTEQEGELIREFQELDKRMEIYVKAIDRRFLVLNNDNSQAKQVEKDKEKWGELPTGTRGELLRDIEKILQEAIDKIDDVAERDAKNELIPISVHILADGAKRFLPQLKSFQDTTKESKELGTIYGAVDFSNQIIEASAKVPRETKKKKKS